MGCLYLLRAWLCVMLFLVFAFELCSPSSSEALLHVWFAKHSIQYKILTKLGGNFYTSPVLATYYFYAIKFKLHWISLNTIQTTWYLVQLVFCCCMPSTNSNSTWGHKSRKPYPSQRSVACKTNVVHVWFQFNSALRAQCAHYTLWRHHVELGELSEPPTQASRLGKAGAGPGLASR